MTDNNLITKYRPTKFSDIVGQDTIVRSLEQVIKNRNSQTFLFTGPSGVGKTTLARIVAHEFEVEPSGLLEIDAATFNGVDDMRGIQEGLQYRALSKSGKRAILLDECHRLSRQAWDALLKGTEEPAKHVVWLFCTTEPGKVPPTVKTRCTCYNLKLIDDSDLDKLYDRICEKEGGEPPSAIGDMIVRQAKGSARQLLTNLAACRGAKNKTEAAELLEAAVETNAIIDLCRLLAANRGSWPSVMAIVKKLKSENAESVRIVVTNYFATAIQGAKDDKQAVHFLQILENFSTPYNPSERHAPLLISIGRTIFA